MAKKLSPDAPETQIQAAIIDLLLWSGVFVWRNYTGGIIRGSYAGKVVMGPNPACGAPDILGVCPGGRLLAIEVKTQKGRISPAQKIFLETINTFGGFAFVARSVDDVERLMPEILAKTG